MLIKENKRLSKEQLLVDMKIQPAIVVGDSIQFLRRQKPKTRIGLYAGRFSDITGVDCVFLSLCKTKCDLLIVAVESNYSARIKKEGDLTKQSDNERLFALSTLNVVDYVILYDEEDASTCLQIINPDIVFSGLYEENEENKHLPRTNKIERIEHPFDLRSNKKLIPLKYFNLG